MLGLTCALAAIALAILAGDVSGDWREPAQVACAVFVVAAVVFAALATPLPPRFRR